MAQKSRTTTRKDVARLANVSETVVSYVLNNNRYVAADKRERVLKAVEQLHYRPNSIARALKGKGSGHILFIADNIENEYFGRIVHAMDAIAYTNGYIISLLAVRNNQNFISDILSHRVDAVIISSVTLEEHYIQDLIDAGIPVVLLMNRDYSAVHGAGRIYTGIESGIMACVKHLHETGCRHIVHVDRVSNSGHFSTRRDLRYRGFCSQMEVLGLPLDDGSFLTDCLSFQDLFEKTCRLVKQDPTVDGFVCRNDQLACTVLSAVLSCDKKVPEEIQITGFDNSSMSELVRPPLSTVEIERNKIACAAIDIVNDILKGKELRDQHFQTKLILRGTTRS